MRKVFILVLTVILTFTIFSGCSSGATTTSAPNAQTSATTTQKVTASTTTSGGTTTSSAAPASDPWARFKKYDIKPKKQYNFVYANWSDKNAFSVIVTSGFKAACDYYGVKLTVVDNKVDPMQANSNADNAITMGADFYFQYNQDEEVNNRIGEKLSRANIKAITIQVPMANKDYKYPAYYVDNYGSGMTAGTLLGEKAAAKWGKDEKLILFALGYPESGALFQKRAKGAIDGVKKTYPNITVFENSTMGDTEVARQRMADFLTAHPEGKILVWTNADHVALGEIAAIKAAGRTKDVLLVSNAADPSMMTEMRAPDTIVVGTIDFDPKNWGWELVPKAIEWLNDGKEPEKLMAPTSVLITKENVDKYYPISK